MMSLYFLPEKKRLRQPGRSHQAYFISKSFRNTSLTETKSACGSQEDLTKLITSQQIYEMLFWPERKRLRQPGRPHQAYNQMQNLAGGENANHACAKYKNAKFNISHAGYSHAMPLLNIKLRQLNHYLYLPSLSPR